MRAPNRVASERRGCRWYGVALIASATLAVGLLIGRSSSAADTAMGRSRAEVGPTDLLRGVPVGYARSPRGAAQAAARYQQALADPAILRPAVLRQRIGVIATPDYAATMLGVNTPGANRIAAGPIGDGLAHGIQTIYRTVPIGYRVESYTSARARVLTWGFTLLGNASAVEPEAYFGVAHTDLVWRNADWKIAGTRSGFGPSPRVQTPPGPVGGFHVLELAKALKAYGVTP